MTKYEEKTPRILFSSFFSSKIAIYLFLGLHTARPSYRRSLLPPKENIQHFSKNGI
jgi:hypothetical protein